MGRSLITNGGSVLIGLSLGLTLWAASARADWEFSGWNVAGDSSVKHVFTGSAGKAAFYLVHDFDVVAEAMTVNTSVCSVVLCNNGDQLQGNVISTQTDLTTPQSISPSCPDGASWGGTWVYQ
jgi:hypothetical protein